MDNARLVFFRRLVRGMQKNPSSLRSLIPPKSVIPVITIRESDNAVALVEAMYRGGVRSFEFVMRTGAAIPAAKLIKETFTDCLVAVGTVMTVEDMSQAAKIDADFAVSPGLSATLVEYARQRQIAYMPGISTVSEAMRAMDLGFDLVKFYPAELAGGIEMLKQLQLLLPAMYFCPSGGVNAERLVAYLSLPNVHCAGGSWMAPQELVLDQDWSGIEQLARALPRIAA